MCSNRSAGPDAGASAVPHLTDPGTCGKAASSDVKTGPADGGVEA